MFHTPRKAALFISVLGLLSVTTTGLYSVHAEEPAMIAYHEHRESHTTSRETTTWSEKTSTSKKSTSHSTSVNVPDAGIIAGTVLFSGLEKSSLTHFAEGYEDSQPASVSTGRAIISLPEDSDILPFGNQSVTWVIGDDKKDFTLLSVDGQILAHFTGNQIKEVTPFHHGFSRVKTDTGTGLMDETGTWALPPQYRTIHFYS